MRDRATLFISDLHLDPRRPAMTGLLRKFLEQPAREAEALYILGDLFEAWIGDDDDAEPGPTVAAALRTLTDVGVPVYFLHGNRDFLLGERFAAASGVQLLPESAVIELTGEPVLLLHGDTLCIEAGADSGPAPGATPGAGRSIAGNQSPGRATESHRHHRR